MIDWQRVDELREEVGPEDFDEVVELFLEEVEGLLAQIMGSDDMSTLAEDMHFLKGCALNMGFKALTAACEQGESLQAKGIADRFDASSVEEIYLTSKQMFLTELAGAQVS